MATRTLQIVTFLLLVFGANYAFSQNFYKDQLPRYQHIQLGIGPSVMYADNGGPYRGLNFPIHPSVTLAYSQKLSHKLHLRGTVGGQPVSSSTNYGMERALEWGEMGQAFTFSGTSYFVDIMPEFYLLPFNSHMERSHFNFALGAGVGLVILPREQVIITSSGEETSKITGSSLYIPIRFTVTYALGPLWDIGFEGSLLATFSDKLDGNEGYNKANDMFIQTQIVIKRYLSPFPFWKR